MCNAAEPIARIYFSLDLHGKPAHEGPDPASIDKATKRLAQLAQFEALLT